MADGVPRRAQQLALVIARIFSITAAVVSGALRSTLPRPENPLVDRKRIRAELEQQLAIISCRSFTTANCTVSGCLFRLCRLLSADEIGRDGPSSPADPRASSRSRRRCGASLPC